MYIATPQTISYYESGDMTVRESRQLESLSKLKSDQVIHNLYCTSGTTEEEALDRLQTVFIEHLIKLGIESLAGLKSAKLNTTTTNIADTFWLNSGNHRKITINEEAITQTIHKMKEDTLSKMEN